MRYITKMETYTEYGTRFYAVSGLCLNVNQVIRWSRGHERLFKVFLSDGEVYEFDVDKAETEGGYSVTKFLSSIKDVFGFVYVHDDLGVFVVYNEHEVKLWNMLDMRSKELEIDDETYDAYMKFSDYNYNPNSELDFIASGVVNGVILPRFEHDTTNSLCYNFIWTVGHKYPVIKLGRFDAYISEEFDKKPAIETKDDGETYKIRLICFDNGTEICYNFIVGKNNYKEFKVLLSKCLLMRSVG